MLRLGFTNIRISLFFSTSLAKIPHFQVLVSPNRLESSNILLLIADNTIYLVTNLLIYMPSIGILSLKEEKRMS